MCNVKLLTLAVQAVLALYTYNKPQASTKCGSKCVPLAREHVTMNVTCTKNGTLNIEADLTLTSSGQYLNKDMVQKYNKYKTFDLNIEHNDMRC